MLGLLIKGTLKHIKKKGKNKWIYLSQEDKFKLIFDFILKPAVQSSVIATPKEDRSRQNSIEEQARDRKGQAR
jgi:hypothetical protein